MVNRSLYTIIHIFLSFYALGFSGLVYTLSPCILFWVSSSKDHKLLASNHCIFYNYKHHFCNCFIRLSLTALLEYSGLYYTTPGNYLCTQAAMACMLPTSLFILLDVLFLCCMAMDFSFCKTTSCRMQIFLFALI